MAERRISRKLALAETTGCSFDEVERYQPGHTAVPMFQYEGDVFAVVKQSELRAFHEEPGCFERVAAPVGARAGNWQVFRRAP